MIGSKWHCNYTSTLNLNKRFFRTGITFEVWKCLLNLQFLIWQIYLPFRISTIPSSDKKHFGLFMIVLTTYYTIFLRLYNNFRLHVYQNVFFFNFAVSEIPQSSPKRISIDKLNINSLSTEIEKHRTRDSKQNNIQSVFPQLNTEMSK